MQILSTVQTHYRIPQMRRKRWRTSDRQRKDRPGEAIVFITSWNRRQDVAAFRLSAGMTVALVEDGTVMPT